MSIPRVDVTAIGSVTWDRYLVVPRFPRPEEKLRAIGAVEHAGGGGPSTLIPLRRWGLSGRVVGWIGDDPAGRQTLDDLDAEGLDVSGIVRRERGETRRGTILVDNGTGFHSVITDPVRMPPLTPDEIPEETFATRVLHVDVAEEPAGMMAIRRARRHGAIIVLNANRSAEASAELLGLADWVIASQSFAADLTSEERVDLAAYALTLRSRKPVVVLNGPAGCEFAHEGESLRQPAYPTPVVDATGASDAFRAGFIYGLLAAWDLRRTLKFACWAAGRVCAELGRRRGIPTTDAIQRFSQSER